mmetsp:Transcript_9136/g.13686  ORF Transcript_9136/g.13686 Transcript_9136/m.13686 type:complete len:221 (-) Transcript_9136:109-771(-)
MKAGILHAFLKAFKEQCSSIMSRAEERHSNLASSSTAFLMQLSAFFDAFSQDLPHFLVSLVFSARVSLMHWWPFPTSISHFLLTFLAMKSSSSSPSHQAAPSSSSEISSAISSANLSNSSSSARSRTKSSNSKEVGAHASKRASKPDGQSSAESSNTGIAHASWATLSSPAAASMQAWASVITFSHAVALASVASSAITFKTHIWRSLAAFIHFFVGMCE